MLRIKRAIFSEFSLSFLFYSHGCLSYTMDGFLIQGVTQYKFDMLLAVKIRQPVPGNMHSTPTMSRSRYSAISFKKSSAWDLAAT